MGDMAILGPRWIPSQPHVAESGEQSKRRAVNHGGAGSRDLGQPAIIIAHSLIGNGEPPSATRRVRRVPQDKKMNGE